MNFYRALRQATIIKHLRGKEPFHWVKAKPSIQEFGSKYGRWGIDTSKLCADTVVMTFGLGDDVTFEPLIDHDGTVSFTLSPDAEYRVIEPAVAQGGLPDVSQLLLEFHHFLPTMSVQQTEAAVPRSRALASTSRGSGEPITNTCSRDPCLRLD